MKRLIGLIVLGVLGFYVAWPAFSGYQIKSALDARDAATLDSKIDFPSVRSGLRPTVTQRVGEMFDRVQSGAGPTGSVIAAQLKGDVIPKVVETSLNTIVTSANLIRIVHDGRSWKESIDAILREQIKLPGLGAGGGDPASRAGGMKMPGGFELPGGLGGLADKMGINAGKALEGLNSAGKGSAPPTPAPTAGGSPAPASFGLGNIKRFAFLGPLAFEVGVAKDASATAPDVTAQMAFTGFDWRVVQVVPRM